MTPLSLSAAFAAGLATSLHCLTMCGGIAGALALRARRQRAGRAAIVLRLLGHQLGRIAGYGVLGALAGTIGQALGAALVAWHVIFLFRAMAAALIMALGLQLILDLALLGAIERGGARLWRRLLLFTRGINPKGVSGTLLLGMVWAFMPCGLVYSMLAIAALTAGPLTGAALMLLFGAGTLPAVLGGSLLLSCGKSRFLTGYVATHAAGALLIIFGVWTAASILWD